MRDYNKYLEDGRRLSCFGQVIEEVLKITIIICSKKDQFSKKKAYQLYRHLLNGDKYCSPMIIEVELNKENPIKVFKKTLNRLFYRKHYKTTKISALLEEEILSKGKTDIIVKSQIKHSKWKH